MVTIKFLNDFLPKNDVTYLAENLAHLSKLVKAVLNSVLNNIALPEKILIDFIVYSKRQQKVPHADIELRYFLPALIFEIGYSLKAETCVVNHNANGNRLYETCFVLLS